MSTEYRPQFYLSCFCGRAITVSFPGQTQCVCGNTISMGITREVSETPKDILANEYQKQAQSVVFHPAGKGSIIYPAIGLAGELGELVNKLKKYWRDQDIVNGKDLTEEQKDALIYEMGDIEWYLSELCSSIGRDFAEVLLRNIEKLKSRQDRGTLQGSGDDR